MSSGFPSVLVLPHAQSLLAPALSVCSGFSSALPISSLELEQGKYQATPPPNYLLWAEGTSTAQP